MDHLAIPVRDEERSRRFYEAYFGFGARPARHYEDDVVMLYNASGFALALRPTPEPIVRPSWMHYGVGLPDRDAVLALRDRLASEGVELARNGTSPTTSASSAATPTATSLKHPGSRRAESGVASRGVPR
jgi:catechol 2,3-dioxygenase-like lactoylglutathione lyase family enzyme